MLKGSVFLGACLCLFWSVHCSDNDRLSSLLARGVEEDVTFKASEVDDKVQQILAQSRPPGRPPRVKRGPVKGGQKTLTCKLKKYNGIYYFGMLITINGSIDSAELCGSVCWKYGRQCQSANYLKGSRTCELMQDQLDVKSVNMLRFYAEEKYDAVYIIPINCTEAEPTPSQPDKAPPKTATCGQTFVEPRIPGDALSRRGDGQRIVGGTEARPHSLPWQVSLRQGYTYVYHFCGGTLLRVSDTREETDIVVTAAHCLYEKPTNLQVAVGAHNVYKQAEGEQRVKAGTFVLHPDYNDDTMINDIAIVKLDTPVKFTNTAQPACLPPPGEKVPDKTPGLVSGWGHLEENGDGAKDLMQVVLPTIPSEKCIASYKGGDEPMDINPELMLCAGYDEGGRDACQGDSGGPFVFKSKQGAFILQGVVSFGEGCAKAGKPGIYARVSTYIDWIQQKIKELSVVKN